MNEARQEPRPTIQGAGGKRNGWVQLFDDWNLPQPILDAQLLQARAAREGCHKTQAGWGGLLCGLSAERRREEGQGGGTNLERPAGCD